MFIYDIIPPQKRIKQIKKIEKAEKQIKKISRKTLPCLIAVLLIFQMFLPVQMFFNPPRIEIQQAQASSDWLSGWDYRTPIEIDNNAEDLTNYQVKIILQGGNPTAANYVDFDKVLASGADIRFTDSDKITEIDFWIEEWIDTSGSESATVWLEVPSILTAGIKTVYVYYGKTGVSSGSDGDNTFEFFDGFDDFDDYTSHPYISDGSARATAYEMSNKIIRYGNKTHITYLKYDSGSYKVYVKTYHHDTDIWDDDVYIATTSDDHGGPCLAIASTGYLHIMYDGHAGGIKHRISTNPNDASSWQGATQVASDWATYPAVVIDSNDKIHMVYADTHAENNRRMHYIRYEDGAWGNDVIFAEQMGYRVSYSNSIAIDSDDVLHVAVFFYLYSELKGKKAGYAKSTDSGNTWKKSDGTSYTLPISYNNLEAVETGDDLRLGNIAVDSDNHPMFTVNRRYNSPEDAQFWRHNGANWIGTVIEPPLENLGYVISQYVSTGWYDGVIFLFASVATTYGWPPSDDGDIYIFYSENNGASFSAKRISVPDSLNPSWMPNVERDNGANTLSEMRLLWTNVGSNPTKIYFAKINASYDAELYTLGGGLDKWNNPAGSITISNGILSMDENLTYLVTKDIVSTQPGAFRAKLKFSDDDYQQFFYGTDDVNGLTVVNALGFLKYSLMRKQTKKDWVYTNQNDAKTGMDTYRVYEILWKADEAKFYDNDNLEATITTNVPTEDMYLLLRRSNSPDTPFYADWTLARKYVSTGTEPTATTTSSSRGYDKIFSGITNTISATDYVSYSAEPTVSNLIDMTITPALGSIDASIDTWNTSGTYYKKWTETGDGTTGNTAHTIGDLRTGQYYQVKVDSSIIETLQTDGSGQISFTYSGGYSDKEFEVEEIPLAPTIGAPAVLSSSSIQWNFTDNADNETGFRVYDNTDTLAVSSATADLTYLNETGLSENILYTGRYATAYNNYGNSVSSSAASSIYTLADTPINLATSAQSANQIDISVDAFPNHSAGSSGYYFENTITGSNSGWIQTNIWQNTGLSCGTSYTYTVKYRNGDGTETDTISLTQFTNGCGSGLPPGAYNPPTQPLPTAENPKAEFKILINNGDEQTNSNTVTLNLFAGSNTKRMSVSEHPDFIGAGQEPYQETKVFTLSNGNEEKTIYAKFYTQYGIASEIVSDTIILKYTGSKIYPETSPKISEARRKEILTEMIEIVKKVIQLYTELLQTMKS